MIRFGICDDNYRYMQRAGEIICAKFDELKTFDEECTCIFYSSGKELFECFEKDKIDIYFLDIECGEENGFEIARKLKKLNKNAALVYITNYRHYIVDAFICRPLGFICKDTIDHDICIAMTNIVEYWEENALVYITNYRHYIVDAFICRPLGFICKDTIDHDICIAMTNIVEYWEEKKAIIIFNVGKNKYTIEAYRIISVKVCNHSVILNLIDNKEVVIHGPLSGYEKKLKERGFVQISRGVLINKKFVSDVSHGKVSLSTGEILTVSRRRIKEVQESCDYKF